MDENVPIRASGSAAAARNNGHRSDHLVSHGKRKRNKLKLAILSVGVIVLVAVLSFVGLSVYKATTAANIDSTKYQAVFLTNGQVYFGKLHTLNGGYMKLTDIYYLQTSSSSDSSSIQDSTDNASDVQLIKLGDEIHGPSDEMIISKDQILFFENLKKDGKVVESISKYKSQ